ncbi:hypothetical protein WCX49_04585 [Sulfurimonas sp. HSL-1656]|uniref:hypothetical protein n=1 Tax=Thiomicrolovo subterrani TaxID=3131934 RepID=UPI0031F75A17
MRRGFAFLISSVAAAALMTGCAKLNTLTNVLVPSHVDLESAKKMKMPVVIYDVDVETDDKGDSRPVVYFVNASPKPVDMATFYVEGITEDGKTVTLWADDYERVAPDKSSQKGVLGGKWSKTNVKCIEIKKAGFHIDGVDYRFIEENINQLFQNPSLNECN